jgi:diaminohydroxyphosphoribosylaminopyrimidine deaminase / 5-amino-6-(5-phosphoribosylamino)uracil reductase
MADAIDLNFMRQAIEISKSAPARPNCFRVGAVLVNNKRKLLSTGFTLEFGDTWHAEASAIKKAKDAKLKVRGATIYSSLEPCSVRKSGGKDCAALLIENGIAQVFYAMAEPPIFVNCQGERKLTEAGIKVEKIEELEATFKEINKHLV